MKLTVFRLCAYGIFMVGLACWACDGSPTREAADDTVKELSGQKHVERMQKMKKTIETTQEQQNGRYQALDAEPKEKGASSP